VHPKKQQGQGVPLRFVENGQKAGTAHEDQSSRVVHDVEEVDGGRHHAAEDHHQHREARACILQ
jgi:hypothetical protein